MYVITYEYNGETIGTEVWNEREKAFDRFEKLAPLANHDEGERVDLHTTKCDTPKLNTFFALRMRDK